MRPPNWKGPHADPLGTSDFDISKSKRFDDKLSFVMSVLCPEVWKTSGFWNGDQYFYLIGTLASKRETTKFTLCWIPQKGELTCWQGDMLTSWHVDKLTCWQAVMLTNWHADNVNLTCWQPDMLTCWQANMLTCWHVDKGCQKLLNVAQRCQKLPQVAIS